MDRDCVGGRKEPADPADAGRLWRGSVAVGSRGDWRSGAGDVGEGRGAGDDAGRNSDVRPKLKALAAQNEQKENSCQAFPGLKLLDYIKQENTRRRKQLLGRGLSAGADFGGRAEAFVVGVFDGDADVDGTGSEAE